MFKIGEFSKINKITVKALRLYDEIGLLKPKNVDEFSGYRFYETDQLPLVQKIISLKQMGFSLAEIAEILNNSANILAKMEKKFEETKRQTEINEERMKQIEHYIQILKKEDKMSYDIVIKELPEVNVASMRKVIANYDEFNTIYPLMGELMRKQNLECINPGYCFTLYHNDEYREKDIDVEICESVVKPGKDEGGMVFKKFEKVPEAACTFHKGPYTSIGQAYGAIMQWVENNGYEIAGNIRESYVDGCWNKDDPNEWLTEVQAPIRKKM